MGIQGLHQVLRPYLVPTNVSEFKGQRVGIDASSWLHRGIYTCAADLIRGARPWEARGVDPPYVAFCMRLCAMLIEKGVTPIVVFDGGAAPLKEAERDRRRDRRDANMAKALEFLASEGPSPARGFSRDAEAAFGAAAEVTPLMARELQRALRREGVLFCVAPYEADGQLAYLCREGEVAAVVTEDSDLVVYGAPTSLFKLDASGACLKLSLPGLYNGALHTVHLQDEGQMLDLLSETLLFNDFTPEMFRLTAALGGCDFLPNLPGVGFRTAYKLVRQFRSLESVVRMLRLKFSKKAAAAGKAARKRGGGKGKGGRGGKGGSGSGSVVGSSGAGAAAGAAGGADDFEWEEETGGASEEGLVGDSQRTTGGSGGGASGAGGAGGASSNPVTREYEARLKQAVLTFAHAVVYNPRKPPARPAFGAQNMTGGLCHLSPLPPDLDPSLDLAFLGGLYEDSVAQGVAKGERSPHPPHDRLDPLPPAASAARHRGGGHAAAAAPRRDAPPPQGPQATQGQGAGAGGRPFTQRTGPGPLAMVDHEGPTQAKGKAGQAKDGKQAAATNATKQGFANLFKRQAGPAAGGGAAAAAAAAAAPLAAGQAQRAVTPEPEPEARPPRPEAPVFPPAPLSDTLRGVFEASPLRKRAISPAPAALTGARPNATQLQAASPVAAPAGITPAKRAAAASPLRGGAVPGYFHTPNKRGPQLLGLLASSDARPEGQLQMGTPGGRTAAQAPRAPSAERPERAGRGGGAAAAGRPMSPLSPRPAVAAPAAPLSGAGTPVSGAARRTPGPSQGSQGQGRSRALFVEGAEAATPAGTAARPIQGSTAEALHLSLTRGKGVQASPSPIVVEDDQAAAQPAPAPAAPAGRGGKPAQAEKENTKGGKKRARPDGTADAAAGAGAAPGAAAPAQGQKRLLAFFAPLDASPGQRMRQHERMHTTTGVLESLVQKKAGAGRGR